MFSLVSGSTEIAEVQLEESSEALEVALPYLYPKRVEPFVLSFPKTWEVVKLCDKYEVSSLSEKGDRRAVR